MKAILDPEPISSRLIRIRGSKQITQQELADRMGGHVTALSHWEDGRRRPSYENIQKLCVALNCSADYLLGIQFEQG